ncbi:hypothetical protein PRJ_5572 (plasmid) [Pseudomonas sp. XWY-1]|nr:hypothetical protein PRJ_5572 [Pseudomonas sp. XWY-1]
MGAFFYLKFNQPFECTHCMPVKLMAAPMTSFLDMSNFAVI